MWVMKLKVESKNQFLGRIALKYKVSITGYPLSYYKDDKWIYLQLCGFIFGPEKNKKIAIKKIKKEPECIKIETNRDFSVILTKQPLFTEPFWNPKIIRPEPTIINYKEKKHTWLLASFDKKVLMNVFKLAKKFLGAELLKLKEENISNISITKILPEVTQKQKRALDLAIQHGYYDYPKKIKLEELAKIMKVSYSTFQFHLKKAEGQVLPCIYKSL